MAKLHNPEINGELVLLAPTTIGRSRENQILVLDDLASRFHVVIYRTDGEWWLESRSRTNGTWMDGELLRLHDKRPLRKHSRLRLGRAGNDPGYDWVVTDDSPPLPSLLVEGEEYIELVEEETRLAAGEGAEAIARRWADSAGGMQVSVDGGEGPKGLGHRDVFYVGDKRFELFLPEELNQTVGGLPSDALALRVVVGRCREDINVQLDVAGARHPFGICGDHAELVLRLAEERLEDRRQGVPPELEGYTHADELVKQLKKSSFLINTYCSRINKAARRTGLLPSGQLIAYHKGLNKRRIEVANLEVVVATP